MLNRTAVSNVCTLQSWFCCPTGQNILASTSNDRDQLAVCMAKGKTVACGH